MFLNNETSAAKEICCRNRNRMWHGSFMSNYNARSSTDLSIPVILRSELKKEYII